MSQPAARVGDMHTCPMVTPGAPPVPHVGGPIAMGSHNVLICKMPAARMGDMATCVGPPDTIVKGSPVVLINGKPAARMGDNTAHGGVIVVGAPTVLIGTSGGGGGGGGGGAKAKAKKKGGFFSNLLDGVQLGLDIVGLIPGVGEIADGINAAIYLARGDYANAALSAAAMVPFAGWAATGGKLAMKGAKGLKAANKAAKVTKAAKKADKAADVGKTVSKTTKAAPPPKAKAGNGKKMPNKKNTDSAETNASSDSKIGCNTKKCDKVGHPVDVASGKVFTEKVDFSLSGSIPLVWERIWHSTSTYQGSLGHGWHHSYDYALGISDNKEAIALRLWDGRSVVFPYIQEGEESFNRAEKMSLKRDERGFYVQNASLLQFRFGQVGFNKKTLPLIAIEDNNGNKIQFHYNEHHHLQSIVDSIGRLLEVSTNKRGLITTITVPHADKPKERFTIVKYQYDSFGNMIIAADALDKEYIFTYQNHLLVREINRVGLSFYFKYDGTNHRSRCIHTWGDDNIYECKLFYKEGHTTVENSLGHITEYFHNKQGLVYKTIDAKRNIRLKDYNEHTELISETNELGLITTYAYDNRGNRIMVIEADGTTTSMEYEESLLTKAIDAVGGEWEWKYDEQGNVIERINPIGATTKYEYKEGLLTQISDALENTTELKYDSDKNLIEVKHSNEVQTYRAYDYLGRVISTTDDKGNKQKYAYNLLSNVVEIQEADGNIRQLEYDAEENVVHAKDVHHDIRFEYGGFNKLIARIEAGTKVSFRYDTEEQLRAIANEKGHRYTFKLDELGEVVKEKGFDGLTREYSRNEASQVIAVKRPNKTTTNYQYDELGRVIEVTHSDGTGERFGYRADGALLRAENDHTLVQFERDILGRVLKEIQGEHFIEQDYDILGRRKEVRSSLGASLIFNRNRMGDVEQLSADSNGKLWEAQFKRDSWGLELERLLPGGVSSQWKRDQLGRPIEQRTSVGKQNIRKRSYTWESNDRLKQIVDSKNGTTTFGHDVFGNLSWAKYGNGQTELRMPDVVGNLFRTKSQKDRKYGAAGQLLEANGTLYKYDTEGNLIKKQEHSGRTWKYQWNASGMLKEVIRPDKKKVFFEYDALGRRTSKTYQEKTTHWVWDGNTPLHEWKTEVEKPQITVLSNHKASDNKIKISPKVGAISVRKSPSISISKRQKTEKQAIVESTNLNSSPIPNITTWIFEPESFAPIAKMEGEQTYSIVTDYLGTPLSMLDDKGGQVWSGDLSIYGKLQNFEGKKQVACP
ncbi:MAG: PAAR domain-containing protein, partial [Chitinophagales bacterium]